MLTLRNQELNSKGRKHNNLSFTDFRHGAGLVIKWEGRSDCLLIWFRHDTLMHHRNNLMLPQNKHTPNSLLVISLIGQCLEDGSFLLEKTVGIFHQMLIYVYCYLLHDGFWHIYELSQPHFHHITLPRIVTQSNSINRNRLWDNSTGGKKWL